MIVDCAIYRKGERVPGPVELGEIPDALDDTDTWVWIGLHDPTPDELTRVQDSFSLHELAIEDALEVHQRPKLEVYEDSVLMVLKTARYDDEQETVDFGEIQIFLGRSFLVHVRYGEASPLRQARHRMELRPDLVAAGPSAALYAIVDRVVDDYEPVVAGLDNDIEEVEEEVFGHRGVNPVERIYFLMREVLELRTALAPLVAALADLVKARTPFAAAELSDYFRDVADHLVRELDTVQNQRELLSSVLQANLTRTSVRQNEDMRKISAWVAIAAVPTMIAGIYGMNFEHMPELQQSWGYPAVLGVMAIIAALMYRGFRKAGWL